MVGQRNTLREAAGEAWGPSVRKRLQPEQVRLVLLDLALGGTEELLVCP